jgi:FG-GAP repeat protein
MNGKESPLCKQDLSGNENQSFCELWGALLHPCWITVFLFFGSQWCADAEVVELISPNPEDRGHFGHAVSGIPDVNRDGCGDVVVRAEDEDPDESPRGAGRAYVFDGSSGTLLLSLVSPNEQQGGEVGSAVSGVGDVNGDGRGDVIVGAHGESPGSSPTDAGRVYVYDGYTGSLLHTLSSPSEKEHGEFGSSLSGIPDVNGDGRGDVIVAAMGECHIGQSAYCGRVYIFDGSNGEVLCQPTCSNDFGYGYFGKSVSGIPDVNADGRGDAIVGAAFDPTNYAGRAFVFDGSSGVLLQSLASPTMQGHGEFGGSVSGLHDVNGDGAGDVVVGAYFEDPANSLEDAGRAYVFISPFEVTASPLFRSADLNKDSIVNHLDLIELLVQRFEEKGVKGIGWADLNRDALIDDWDLFLFQYEWGPSENRSNE